LFVEKKSFIGSVIRTVDRGNWLRIKVLVDALNSASASITDNIGGRSVVGREVNNLFTDSIIAWKIHALIVTDLGWVELKSWWYNTLIARYITIPSGSNIGRVSVGSSLSIGASNSTGGMFLALDISVNSHIVIPWVSISVGDITTRGVTDISVTSLNLCVKSVADEVSSARHDKHELFVVCSVFSGVGTVSSSISFTTSAFSVAGRPAGPLSPIWALGKATVHFLCRVAGWAERIINDNIADETFSGLNLGSVDAASNRTAAVGPVTPSWAWVVIWAVVDLFKILTPLIIFANDLVCVSELLVVLFFVRIIRPIV